MRTFELQTWKHLRSAGVGYYEIAEKLALVPSDARVASAYFPNGEYDESHGTIPENRVKIIETAWPAVSSDTEDLGPYFSTVTTRVYQVPCGKFNGRLAVVTKNNLGYEVKRFV